MDFVERRQAPRIHIDYVTVEVYPSQEFASSPEISEICSVIDLSEAGMRFKADNLYKAGQIIRLTFVLPDSIVVIRTNAIIIHSDSRLHEIGVQFKNLGIAEHKLIQHVIERNLCNS
jgi:c-di-GMP-binding flagellar brake protein YcgR